MEYNMVSFKTEVLTKVVFSSQMRPINGWKRAGF